MFDRNRRATDKDARGAAERAEQITLLEGFLVQARTFDGVTGAEAAEASPLPLKRGERLVFCAHGAALIEPRRAPGRWEGRSQGISIPIPGLRGMRYRVGTSRGTYVQGEEVPTPIDVGSFSVTTKRAVFAGPKHTREWSWSKLLGVTHAVDAPWTAISVSNRQKTSGVLYDEEHEDVVRFSIDLAVAIATEQRGAFVAELDEELAAARARVRP
jgi:hypothetical protein